MSVCQTERDEVEKVRIVLTLQGERSKQNTKAIPEMYFSNLVAAVVMSV